MRVRARRSGAYSFTIRALVLGLLLAVIASCSSSSLLHQPPTFEETNRINQESEGRTITIVLADSAIYEGHSLMMHVDTTEWVTDSLERLAVATADILEVQIQTPQAFAGIGIGLVAAPACGFMFYGVTRLFGATEESQVEALASGFALGFGAGWEAGLAHRDCFDLSKPNAFVDSVLAAGKKR